MCRDLFRVVRFPSKLHGLLPGLVTLRRQDSAYGNHGKHNDVRISRVRYQYSKGIVVLQMLKPTW